MKRHRRLEVLGRFATAPDIRIQFDGKSYSARAGEPLALTLLAHGVYLVGRSAKYHRPRGVFCGRGACSQCLARIDGLPNQRLCMCAARPGSVVEAQNVVGSARFDLLSTIDWLFPAGMDHHHLMTHSPAPLNRVAVSMARELSGLGKLPDTAGETAAAAEELHTQVAVVGAGPAGRAVAEGMRRAGLATLLIDDLADAPEGLGGARVVGLYDDRFLVAVRGREQWRVRADTIVLATGGYEQRPAVPGNDIPGLLSRRAVERALEAGILPGLQVVVALDRDADASTRRRATDLVRRLAESGAEIAATFGFAGPVAGERAVPEPLGGISGRTHVNRARAAEGDESFDCDAVVWCARPVPAYELARQMGVETPFDLEVGGFVPEHDADGRTARPGLYVAGEVAGIEADLAAAHGERVAAAVVAATKNTAAVEVL